MIPPFTGCDAGSAISSNNSVRRALPDPSASLLTGAVRRASKKTGTMKKRELKERRAKLAAMGRAAKVGAVGADTAAAEPGGLEATGAADHAAAAEVTEENGAEADGDDDAMLIDPHQADLDDVAALAELDRRFTSDGPSPPSPRFTFAHPPPSPAKAPPPPPPQPPPQLPPPSQPRWSLVDLDEDADDDDDDGGAFHAALLDVGDVDEHKEEGKVEERRVGLGTAIEALGAADALAVAAALAELNVIDERDAAAISAALEEDELDARERRREERKERAWEKEKERETQRERAWARELERMRERELERERERDIRGRERDR